MVADGWRQMGYKVCAAVELAVSGRGCHPRGIESTCSMESDTFRIKACAKRAELSAALPRPCRPPDSPSVLLAEGLLADGRFNFCDRSTKSGAAATTAAEQRRQQRQQKPDIV